MEADLLRYFHVDLLGLGGKRLSWRRLGALGRQMPPGAGIVAATNPQAAWSTTEHLLATIVDAIIQGNWERVALQVKPKDRPPTPAPIDRPGMPSKRRRANRTTLTPEEMRRRLIAQQQQEVTDA